MKQDATKTRKKKDKSLEKVWQCDETEGIEKKGYYKGNNNK